MRSLPPRTAIYLTLYCGATALLLLDLFFLVRAIFTGNFVPLFPIIAGILTTAGLLAIVYAEHHAREADRREHRRIARVAHQLERPLGALETDLSHMMDQADTLPAEARLKLKHMNTRTKILLENVRDVFLLLQAQTGRIAREVRPYNLCTLVHDVVKEEQQLASARNVEVVTTLHCSDAPVEVDRSLFMIVLHHLIENAAIYTMKPGLVNVAVVRGKKGVRIVVQDRGIGITEKESVAAFQPFARGERAHQFDPDGIGVGLALSRHIIHELNGTLKWRPRSRGMGSEFEISLPLSHAQKK